MANPLESMPAAAKASVDMLSIGTVMATLFNYLPQIAAGFTLLWTILRMSEDPRLVRAVKWLWGLIRRYE